jgi:hypothetical protein
MTAPGSLVTVRAEVTTGGMKHRYCRQVPLHGFITGVPAEAWRAAARLATRELFTKGLICDVCADQPTTGLQDRIRRPSTTRSTTSPKTPHPGVPDLTGCKAGCAALRLSVEADRQVYPLTEDLLTVYGPDDRLRLVATGRPQWGASYAALEVLAQQWTMTDLWWRHRLMETVVGNLGLGRSGRRWVRTFIGDGKRDIPYLYNWARPASQPGR